MAKDKPPVFGMIERGGAVVIRMLANVQQATIAPLIRATMALGATVYTDEGFGSLLRSWLRPHRGISQEKLPLYLSFFEFVHNARIRGKHLLPALPGVLVA